MLKLTSTAPHRIVTETLIIPVCQDKDIHHSPVIRTLVRQALGIATFQGDKNEEVSLHQPADVKAKRVLFVGLGPHAELTPEHFRQAAGKGVRLAMHAAKAMPCWCCRTATWGTSGPGGSPGRHGGRRAAQQPLPVAL
jgi:hypothetical protein